MDHTSVSQRLQSSPSQRKQPSQDHSLAMIPPIFHDDTVTAVTTAVVPSVSDGSTMVSPTVVMSLLLSLLSSSNWIATIDGDIAKISDNEFAPVFMGGIAVMFGGVLSATILGTILEKGDLYASVVADSYIQRGNNNNDDEEFWKGLSEEERVKGQEILKQLEAKKRGEVYVPQVIGSEPTRKGENENASTSVTTGGGSDKKELDMFTDYE